MMILQVLDALQFLHHRGIVHLNIQPDNIIMISRRRFDIKLVDFGRARRIETAEGTKIPRNGTAEFMGNAGVQRIDTILYMYIAKYIPIYLDYQFDDCNRWSIFTLFPVIFMKKHLMYATAIDQSKTHNACIKNNHIGKNNYIFSSREGIT